MSEPEGGRTVGRYRIVGFLGAGAMGEVYLAEDPHIERKLAIKTVRLVGRPAEIEDRSKRLLREARAAGRLLHPNIVTLFDAGEAEGALFLAFEFVEGMDLAGRLEAAPPLSLREVLRIVRQVADALDYAHRQGIVHRDIKPSNILLSTSGEAAGRVKVADFGIAKVTGQSTELTMAGSVMGSPQYLSPEQIRGDDLDGRSDIFSLGVVLYELLSGKRPFEGETITTLVYQILHKEPPPASSLRMIPPRLEQLVRSLLAKDREERAASAGLVAQELAAIERELDDETLSAPAARSDAMAVTTVLPRRTGNTVPPPLPPPPAPPAMTTHQSAPPPSLPIPQENPPVRPATGRVVATEGIAPKRWLPLVAAVVLIATVGTIAAGWLFLGRRGGGDSQPSEQVAASPTSPISPASPASQATPAPGEPLPAAVQAPPVTSAPVPEEREIRAQEPPKDIKDPRDTKDLRDLEPTPTPRRQPEPPLPEPRPDQPATPVAPVPTPTPEPQRPVEVPVEEPASPATPSGPVGPVMKTGLNLTFRVTPPDAFVLIDRTQIGRAKEWSGQKGARTYELSGPGRYRIRIRAQGMKEHSIEVEAGETGGTTPIFARLSPLPAADVDASDLRTVRVGQAVSFRVRPPGAQILVGGQVVGPARQFNGGVGPRGWLKLPPGRHRVSVTAPGHRQQDILVEVVSGFAKEREKIDVDLREGGG